jgi:flagellar biosynthesis protein FlhB
MSEDTPPDDKPYDPTPARLEEARKKGEIVRSTDLNAAITYGGFLLVLGVFGPGIGSSLGTTLSILLDQAPELARAMLSPGGQAVSGPLLISLAIPVGTILVVPSALLMLSLFAQRAILFTPTKVTPKASRISMLGNAKNKFGRNGLFEFAKSGAKLMIYGALLAWMLWIRRDRILGMNYASAGQITGELGRLTLEFLTAVTMLAALLAVIDYFWQIGAHHRKHRMDRQELVDETRKSEGDPHMKQQRREKGITIALNKMLTEVPGADVVVVNPTHYAVALKWNRDKGEVPICVAKAIDHGAARIREVAAEAGVPIFSDPPTARALFASVEIGQGIAQDHYRAVAAAIRFADRMRKIAGGLT